MQKLFKGHRAPERGKIDGMMGGGGRPGKRKKEKLGNKTDLTSGKGGPKLNTSVQKRKTGGWGADLTPLWAGVGKKSLGGKGKAPSFFQAGQVPCTAWILAAEGGAVRSYLRGEKKKEKVDKGG